MDLSKQCVEEGGHFGIADYAVLGFVLAVSSLIGVVLSWKKSDKQKSSQDFFLGGSMGTIPTALSLAAGFLTAIELLGNPSEVYSNGTQFWMICISFVLVVPITSYLFLPVFMKLQLTSSYEYFELRFNNYIRVFAAFMYIIQMIFYTSVAVYAPALALSNVTGLNTYVAVTAVYIICIFYASQGGMKAVIYTDTFQAAIMVISIIAVMVAGHVLTEGGLEQLIESNTKSGRFEFFLMNPSPTIRHSLWSVVIGGTFYWATLFCANQSTIQKYLSVGKLENARKALWISCFGLILVFSINFATGLVLYDFYKGCDPYVNKEISAMDELLPYFVMKVLGHLKGIPGLFVSGIFAASLGTVASAVNSLSAVTMRDLISGLCRIKIPDDKAASVSKWLSLFFGLFSFALVFVVEQLGGILQVALSFNGITGGVTLGLFALGMLFPWANSKGAMTGGLFGLILVGWIGLGAQYASITTNWDFSDPKPISVDECRCNVTLVEEIVSESPLWIYKVSYLWYSAIGCVSTFLVGSIVSLLTTPEKPWRLNEDLLAPPVLTFIKKLSFSLQVQFNIVQMDKELPDIFRNISNNEKLEGVLNLSLTLEDEKTKVNKN